MSQPEIIMGYPNVALMIHVHKKKTSWLQSSDRAVTASIYTKRTHLIRSSCKPFISLPTCGKDALPLARKFGEGGLGVACLHSVAEADDKIGFGALRGQKQE